LGLLFESAGVWSGYRLAITDLRGTRVGADFFCPGISVSYSESELLAVSAFSYFFRLLNSFMIDCCINPADSSSFETLLLRGASLEVFVVDAMLQESFILKLKYEKYTLIELHSCLPI
jgi:hypothetical protein